MFVRLAAVSRMVWLLLLCVVAVTSLSFYVKLSGSVDVVFYQNVIRPISIIAVAILAFVALRGKQDRIRHKSEKAIIIACILSVWFVLYFMSGLIVTYVYNTLVVDIRSVALNLFVYGVAAAATEYVRYSVMLLGGRRNVVWLGAVTTVVFTLFHINLTQLWDVRSLEDIVKFSVSDIAPIFVSNLLLTYLAFNSGYGPMLVYRLGVVAATILPPIIPKHDWYLIGVSSILLAAAVYIAVDRNAQGREQNRRKHHRRHIDMAYDVMLLSVMTFLVLFVTGFFTYKPTAIMSDSMKPVFGRGAVVVVQKIDDPMDVEVGDIIQYELIGKMVTHRVVAIDSTEDGSGERVFITKGDNNPSRDPDVASAQVKGIVRAQVPYIGYPTVWLREVSR